MERTQFDNELEEFTTSYIATMLTILEGRVGGCYYSDDIAEPTLAAIKADCEAFYKANRELILSEAPEETERVMEAGYDFWLTRAGHGAGFWDGSWPKNGDRLDKAVKAGYAYTRCEPYVGDDGKVWILGTETWECPSI